MSIEAYEAATRLLLVVFWGGFLAFFGAFGGIAIRDAWRGRPRDAR